jgi:hypothetical protein
MNQQIRDFYRVNKIQEPYFQEVRFLNEEKHLDWEEASRLGIPRGWYELSQLSPSDRVEFCLDTWQQTLPFHDKVTNIIEAFFEALDDVVVVACLASEEDPWRAELVYSLADNSTFFRGLLPADEESILWAKKWVRSDLPADYWTFFRLHNGFGRRSELNLLSLEDLEEARDRLISRVLRAEKPLFFRGEWISPEALYPFYEEFGLGSFQCFNAEWYPGGEMGNVYFSGIDYTLSDITDPKAWSEMLAYPTFLEWLAAYLEGTNRCI